MMCFHATIHPGEAVYQSLLCNLVPNAHHLVLNKGDRIEAYTITATANRLSPLTSFTVPGWATIMAIDKAADDMTMTDDDQPTDSIVFLTKSRRLFCIKFNPETNQFDMIGQADLSEAASRPPKKPFLLIHDGIAICHVSMGLLKLVNVKSFPKTNRHLTKAVTVVRVSDLAIQDAVIWSGRLLVLTKRASQDTIIKHYLIPEHSRTGSSTNKTVSVDDTFGELVLDVLSPGYRLILLSDHQNEDGYLILTIDHILYHNPSRSIKIGRTIGSVVFEAITCVERGRFVGIDTDGMLYSVQVDEQRQDVQVDRLGRTGRANTLSYLGDGILFVGSESGPSFTLQLLESPDPTTKHYFSVLFEHSSMAPINSALLCDLNGTGRTTMVAACGENRNGGIALLAKGIGLNCYQETEFPVHISDIDFFMHRGKRYLTVKLIEESYIFSLSDEQELEESSERFIPSGESILLTKNIYNGPLMVITGRRISLYREGERKSMAFAEPPCIMATVSHDLIACVMLSAPHTVFVYQCSSAVGVELCIKPYAMITDGERRQISAIDIRKSEDGTAVLAVSFWACCSVDVYTVTSSQVDLLAQCKLPEMSSTIISILITQSTLSDWAVFMGSVDGAVGCIKLHKTDTIQQHFKLLSSASTRPVRLFKYSRDCVFATGDHPIFAKLVAGVIDVLPVDVSDISAFTHLGDADKRIVAVAAKQRLLICKLEDAVERTRRHCKIRRFRDLEVPTLLEWTPIHQILRHEYPIHVAVGQKAVSVCTLDRPPAFITNLAYQSLVSDNIQFGVTEYPQCSIMTKLEGANEQLLIVGTKVGCKSKFEVSEGRLLVYTISDTGKTSLQCEYVVDGAALNMCEFQGKLAVTIQGKVILFKYKQTPKPSLLPVTDFHGQIFIEAMGSTKQGVLALGDNIKSVVLAKLETLNNEQNFIEASRNVEAHSITAVCMLDEKHVLSADVNGNLMAMTQLQNPIYNDDRFQNLEVTSAFHVGPTVTCLMAGSIGDINTDLLTQPVVYTTRSGSVGLVAQFKDALLYQTLLLVQERLSSPEEREGRQFSGKLTKHSSFQDIVDGDVLFRLFDLDDPSSQLSGLDIDPSRLLSVIEALYNSV